MSKIKFIITRFREKESEFPWIKLMEDFIIFNKGNREELSAELQKHTIDKANVGKDPEVILSYIIDNYDNLDDVLVFTQANLIPHYFYGDDEFVSLITDVEEFGFSHNIKFQHRYEIPEKFFNHATFNLEEYPAGEKMSNYHPDYDLKTWWKKYTGEEYIQNERIFWGCIFGIKKELILHRPKSFYEILREPFLGSANPVETHFIERAWANIFKI
jgi:hypothetical protein